MLKKTLVVLLVSVCILSLSFHFIVEGLGGVQDHFNGHQLPGMMESHEGDQFILAEIGLGNASGLIPYVIVPSSLNQIIRPLPAPFHPPKSF